MLIRYYPRILAVVAVAVFFTNLDVYLFNSETTGIVPLYWIAAFGVVAAPLYFSKGALLSLRQAPIARWGYGFLMITCVWLLFQPSPSEVAWQELRTRSLSVAFILVLMCVFANCEAQVWARRAILVAVLMGIGLNTYELFNPQAFSSIVGRSAGLYINPNQSGAALVLGLVLTISLLPQRLRLLFALMVGGAILLTFSRSAIVGWAIVMIVILKTGQISLRKSLAVGFSVIVIGLIVLVAQWDRIQYQLEDLGVLNSNVMGRVEWFNQPMASDSSALGRQEVAEIAFEKFADNPIFGEGVGASQKLLMVEGGTEISTHNQYLNLMVDHGIMGFFILPLLVLAILWQARGEARHTGMTLAAFTLYIGFFSHNILDERFVLLTFTLLAAMVFSSRQPKAPTARQPQTRPVGSRYPERVVTIEATSLAHNRSAI